MSKLLFCRESLWWLLLLSDKNSRYYELFSGCFCYQMKIADIMNAIWNKVLGKVPLRNMAPGKMLPGKLSPGKLTPENCPQVKLPPKKLPPGKLSPMKIFGNFFLSLVFVFMIIFVHQKNLFSFSWFLYYKFVYYICFIIFS